MQIRQHSGNLLIHVIPLCHHTTATSGIGVEASSVEDCSISIANTPLIQGITKDPVVDPSGWFAELAGTAEQTPSYSHCLLDHTHNLARQKYLILLITLALILLLHTIAYVKTLREVPHQHHWDDYVTGTSHYDYKQISFLQSNLQNESGL